MRFYDVTSWSYVNLDDPFPIFRTGPGNEARRPGNEATESPLKRVNARPIPTCSCGPFALLPLVCEAVYNDANGRLRGFQAARFLVKMDSARVKHTVRALLLSSKHGCTPKQLLSDYRHIVGESLPYESLGYSTFMQYMKSIPDVVKITSQQGMTVLFGVADESTSHIAKMVARQKTAPSLHKRCFSMLNMSSTAHVSREPKVPHTFQLQLKTLMLSYPNGLVVSRFMEAFARRFGYYLNYRGWGFSSVDQMLKTVPNIVQYELDPTEGAYMIKRVSAPTISRPTRNSETDGVIDRARFSRLGESTASKPPLQIGGETTEKTKPKPAPINSK